LSGLFEKIGWKPSMRPRMGKSSAEERFTMMLVSSRGRSRSVGFSLKTLKVLGWLGLTAVCTLVSFVTVYRANRKELVELRYMRDVAESQKAQIQSLQEQFSVLNERVRQAEMIEVQIRDMLNREGIFPQAYTSGGSATLPASRTSPVLTYRDSPSASRLMRTEDMGRALYGLGAGASSLAEKAAKVEADVRDLREEAIEAVAFMRATPSAWPVFGDISSDFGWRVNPFNYYSREYHSGIDIAAQWWEPIAAPADGTVVFSGYKYGYGWTIMIRHGYGFETLYAHCCRLEADWGQEITRGEVIGYVGQSGIATGPHLHYEVHLWGTPVDPTRYLSEEVLEVSHSVR